MAVAFQEDFEAVQNMAKETIFKERGQTTEKAEAIGDANGDDNGGGGGVDDDDNNNNNNNKNSNNNNDNDNELIDNDGEFRKQLKSPLECGFAQTTSKPSLFFKILTDQDVSDRRKARQEKLHRAAVEIAQLEAKRCAEEKHRLKRRELEQKERRLRALIMDELCSLWRKGHVFQIPEEVDPYLRGECGSDPEENEIRKRLFHGCFYEFSNRFQPSRKRFKHKRRTILETVTWTAQEVKLYYECMAKHRIPIYSTPAAFGGAHCSSQGIIVAAHTQGPLKTNAFQREMIPTNVGSNAPPNSSTVVFPPNVVAEYQIASLSEMYQSTGVPGAATSSALNDVTFCRGGASKECANDNYVDNTSSNTNTNNSSGGSSGGGSSSSSSKEGAEKLHPRVNSVDVEFVNELLKENVGIDSGSSNKPDSTTEIDLYDDL